jgi:hypothetical protein
MTTLRQPEELCRRILGIHEAIRDEVVAACEAQATDDLARVVGDDAGDTLFAIDRVTEASLLAHFAELSRTWPCLLIAEGLGHDGEAILPKGATTDDLEIVAIVDPIDGTRGLMYQKRPAWILTGVAPFRRRRASLDDIELAVQTEIPLVKQNLCDRLWAIAGTGIQAERWDRVTGQCQRLSPQPSRASTIAQGFGGLSRFFPGARASLAAIDDEVVDAVLGPATDGRARAFEDQYISTAGQLYELVMGHDRWIADVRPLLAPILRARGRPPAMCCHPYDLSTELIAREAGVIVTDPRGERLRAPLDVFTDVAWVGYANPAIHEKVHPALCRALRDHGMIEG